jgi:hypothetical protein
MNLPDGFYRFTVACLFNGYKYTCVARNQDRAWSKYVTQCFKGEPLKPNRDDYKIEKDK